tara:strand:- start:248 stop:394 length:147 start_codon:yes stop_codon:yes gene_type:complete
MSEQLFSNKLENEDYLNTEDDDYKNLITRLKDISRTIVLLEKTIFKKI